MKQFVTAEQNRDEGGGGESKFPLVRVLIAVLYRQLESIRLRGITVRHSKHNWPRARPWWRDTLRFPFLEPSLGWN